MKASEEERFGEIRDHCGVFGIFDFPESPRMTAMGLYALQHRGQESAGIAFETPTGIKVETGMGYVEDVFPQGTKKLSPSPSAIGHVRYSTAGESALENAQPILFKTPYGDIAVCHNGNLVDYMARRKALEADGALFTTNSDTEIILHLIARSREARVEDAIADALAQVKGAYTLLFFLKRKIIAVRDARGFRPLILGKLYNSWCVASETCALDLIDAEAVREIAPGEMLTIDENGITSRFPFERTQPAQCIFELVYFARPDSIVFNRSVYKARMEMGRQMAREHPIDADFVVPVPDSGLVASLGYAEESKTPYALGLIRNHYIGRTFIQPQQISRLFSVKIKLNPVPEILRGARVVLVDDSIVRGTTCGKLITMLRHAGAREVHMRLSCPPYVGPCFYGVDTPTEEELIASTHSVEEIRKVIGADSLGYLSLEGLLRSVGDENNFCVGCFTKNYPVPVMKEKVQPGLFDESKK